MKTLVIIGSGFSGTVTAIEFLRRRTTQVNVVLINRSGPMARGLAYGTNSTRHLLNVPAGNMSALVDNPTSFLDFCRSLHPDTRPNAFMPRRLYGQYLQELLQIELHRNATTARHLVAEVQRLEPLSNGVRLHLSDGTALSADHVVMALGNFSPTTPSALHDPAINDYYTVDPWANAAEIDSDAPVLLLGSGLTALDVLTSLRQQGHRGDIYMLSRRGLLPTPHRQQRQPAVQDVPPVNESLLAGPATVLSYLRTLRTSVQEHEKSEGDWRDVIAAIRPVTAALWQRLPLKEQQRFLRHVQPFWDVHRHRVAPETYRTFTDTLKSGQLKPLTGRLAGATVKGNLVLLEVRLRYSSTPLQLEVHHIFNCTGPTANLTKVNEPFISQLITDKLLQSDPHQLGLIVDDDLAIVNSQGISSAWLSYVGPMLKARWWEATAVPELRQYSRNLAMRLASLL